MTLLNFIKMKIASCKWAAPTNGGNIINGIDLGRRLHGAELFGLTAPLLTTSSGAKMGKTADGAVWLNADMLSPLRLLAILA